MLGMGPHRKSKDLAASEVSKAEVWHLLDRRPLISSSNYPDFGGRIPCQHILELKGGFQDLVYSLEKYRGLPRGGENINLFFKPKSLGIAW